MRKEKSSCLWLILYSTIKKETMLLRNKLVPNKTVHIKKDVVRSFFLYGICSYKIPYDFFKIWIQDVCSFRNREKMPDFAHFIRFRRQIRRIGRRHTNSNLSFSAKKQDSPIGLSCFFWCRRDLNSSDGLPLQVSRFCSKLQFSHKWIAFFLSLWYDYIRKILSGRNYKMKLWVCYAYSILRKNMWFLT